MSPKARLLSHLSNVDLSSNSRLFLALAGFVIKLFFEFDEEGHSNFYWTHTLWHAFLGLACAFLLPNRAYEVNKVSFAWNKNTRLNRANQKETNIDSNSIIQPYTSTNDNLISYYKSFGDPTFEPNAIWLTFFNWSETEVSPKFK